MCTVWAHRADPFVWGRPDVLALEWCSVLNWDFCFFLLLLRCFNATGGNRTDEKISSYRENKRKSISYRSKEKEEVEYKV